MDQTTGREMPKYKCHKEVWALKIKEVVLDKHEAEGENRETDGSALLHFEEEGYSERLVSKEFMEKHSPEAGCYFIVYKGGYESISPADAFEEGYTLIGADEGEGEPTPHNAASDEEGKPASE